MEIAESAAKVVLDILKSKGLDPQKTYLQLENTGGFCGMSFVLEPSGHVENFHGLKVSFRDGIEKDDLTVEYREVKGKMGLVFCFNSKN